MAYDWDRQIFRARYVSRYDGDEIYYECRWCKVWHRTTDDCKHDAQCPHAETVSGTGTAIPKVNFNDTADD